MAYVPVPKDLTRVKNKVLFNLTKRQLLAFISAATLGLPLFFALKTKTSSTTATLAMVIIMLPFFLIGLYERHGMPLERVLYYLIQSQWIRPKNRPYQTRNFYHQLHHMTLIKQEVQAIVRQKKTPNSPKP